MGKRSQGKFKPEEHAPTLPKTDFLNQHFLTKPLPVFLLIMFLATLIYSNSLSVPFLYDDIQNIVENPRIKRLTNLLDLSGTRYVGFLSFALNYYFGKLNLFGYHLVNLTIHILNAFLVYVLVQLFFKTPVMNKSGSKGMNRHSWEALTTALLFVAHPVQTQTVTYIVQRFASLAALFYLLAVVCYLKWRVTESKYQLFWYIIALISTILAMKTKEISFTLPIMLLLVEAVFFDKLEKRRWIFLIPFLLTLLIIPLSQIDALRGAEVGLAQETKEISRIDYLFTQFRVIVTYIRLLLVPIHQTLDYAYPIYHSFFEPAVFLSFFFLLIVFGLSIYLVFNSSAILLRLVGFGSLWFFLTLSIESSIIPIKDVIYEHRLYLPSVGFFLSCIMLGDEVRLRIGRKGAIQAYSKAIFSLIFLSVIFPLSLSAYMRNMVWKDEVRLWEDVVEKAPQKARGYINLGSALEDMGESEKAMLNYEQALRLNPNQPMAHNNVGGILNRQGKLDDAIIHFSEALKLKPNFDLAHNNLGAVLMKQGKIEEALLHFSEALKVNPQSVLAHYNWGNAMYDQRRFDEAITHFSEALRINPDDEKVHNNLAAALVKEGEADEAVSHYSEAIRLNPNDDKAHYNLADLLVEQGSDEAAKKHLFEAMRINRADEYSFHLMGRILEERGNIKEAITFYTQAVQIKPTNDIFHKDLGVALGKDGKLEEAVSHFHQAVEINPKLESAHMNLGVALITQEKPKEAITHLESAIRIDPKNDKAQYNLGLAYARIGRREDAIRAFKTALQINAQLSEARQGLETIDPASGFSQNP